MNPTFGDKVEGAHYQTRYGVYAVIPNSQVEKSKQARITIAH